MAGGFDTFDLSRILGAAEQIKGMRREEKTDALRDNYLQTQIAGAQQQQGFQQQEQTAQMDARTAKQHYLAAQAVEQASDPVAAARDFAPDLVEHYEKANGPGSFAQLPPEAVKQMASMGKERAAAAAGIDLTGGPELQARLQAQKQQDAANFEQQKTIVGMQQQMTPYQRAQLELQKTQGRAADRKLITRPVGDGTVQDYLLDDRTGERIANGSPYRPATAQTGNVTEGERKAAVLGTRLESSLQALAQLEQQDPGSSRPGLMERGFESMGMESAANASRSSSRQQADTAQLDALDAALTLGTGAAYTREQLEGYRKAYFPQIGDSDQTVAAKQKRFETIVKAARIAAGRAEPSIDTAVAPGQAPPSMPAGRQGWSAEIVR